MARKNEDNSLSKTARSNVYSAVNSFRKQAYNGNGSFANQQSGSNNTLARSSSNVNNNSGLTDSDRQAVYEAVNKTRQNSPKTTADRNPYVNSPWGYNKYVAEKERQDQRVRQAALQQLQNTLNTDITNRAGQIATGSPVSPMTTLPNKNMQAAYDQYKGASLKATLDNIVKQNEQNRLLNPAANKRREVEPITQTKAKTTSANTETKQKG